MENSEIVSGNKIIAEFMGYEYIPHTSTLEKGQQFGWNREIKWNPFLEKHDMAGVVPPVKVFLGRSHHDLHFHMDWGWLMSVWEKIAKLEFKNFQVKDMEIQKTECYLRVVQGTSDYVMGGYACETLIESTFRTIVDFITWYNTYSDKK